MTDITEPARGRLAVLLGYGFRPFFTAAAFWAAAALLLWLAALFGWLALPSRFDALSWHIHEMLFGFVMAAIAGFLLTAIPNWTRRQPVQGALLGGLVALWLAGRVACLVSALLPFWLVLAADLALPVALAAVAGREIAAGRNWRNLVVLGPLTVLGAANLLMHLETQGDALPALLPPGLGWRLGLAAVLVLIALIGGRIVPAFTRNWLMQRIRDRTQPPRLPAPHGWIDRAALALLPLALATWAVAPEHLIAGLLLLAAGLVHLLRLLRWHGARTAAEPLLLALHVGYAWLALGTVLLGLATLEAGVPASAALHALTAGAIGAMVLAVMTRASRGHSGHPLRADRATALVYALVGLAALARVAAAFAMAPAPDWYTPLLTLSAVAWTGAFGLFLFAYWPMLTRPPGAE